MKIYSVRQVFPIVILWFASLFQSVIASSLEKSVVGDAYDIKNQSLLYREVHCGNKNDLEHTVLYQDVEGELIAQKTLDYKTGHLSPSFIQKNLHTEEIISVQLKGQKISMSVQDMREQQPAKPNTEIVKDNLPLVIDAGFDGFIRQHWDSLVTGDRKWFRFPVATRSSLMTFRVESSTCSYDSNGEQCFRLELSGWLYRLLADPIELGYDTVNQRLTRYRGLSNIEDNNKQGQIVDIRYRYDDLDVFTCDVKATATGLTNQHNKLTG